MPPTAKSNPEQPVAQSALRTQRQILQGHCQSPLHPRSSALHPKRSNRPRFLYLYLANLQHTTSLNMTPRGTSLAPFTMMAFHHLSTHLPNRTVTKIARLPKKTHPLNLHLLMWSRTLANLVTTMERPTMTTISKAIRFSQAYHPIRNVAIPRVFLPVCVTTDRP